MFDIGYQIDELISNREISRKLKCGIMGGIRYSNANNAIALFIGMRGNFENIVKDSTIKYMGTGKGDQTLDNIRNYRLAMANENNTAIYLFKWVGEDKCRYLGQVKLVEAPAFEKRINEVGEEETKIFYKLKFMDK